MTRPMPNLGATFAVEVDRILQIARLTEGLWMTARPASSVRRGLKTPQLEALYEATYLRVFATWENFLEEALVRFMWGSETLHYAPVLVRGTPYGTMVDARAALYDGRDYLLWHGVDTVMKRSAKHLVGAPIETVLDASKADLSDYATVRHRIAHGSPDAIAKFKAVALARTGSDWGGKPGRFLRSSDNVDPLNPTKWIRVIADDLVSLASAIAP